MKQSYFFEKISKIDKSLSELTKRQRYKIQINKTGNEKKGIITDAKEIQIFIWT